MRFYRIHFLHSQVPIKDLKDLFKKDANCGSCSGSLLINSQGKPTVTSTLFEDPCRNQTRRQWHLEFQKGNLADRRNSSSQLCKYFSNVLNIFTLSAAMLKQHHGAGNTNCAVWHRSSAIEKFLLKPQNWTELCTSYLNTKRKQMCFL